MQDPSNPEGYVEIRFGPRWKYISVTRGYVQNFIAISMAAESKADKIAMAVSELLENAVKYSSGEETRISLKIFPQADKIIVSVTNQASKEAITSLQGIFSRIMKGDPLQAYIEQMKEAALRTDGKSQLGLVRIRYEVGANIRLEATNDNFVTVTLEVASDQTT